MQKKYVYWNRYFPYVAIALFLTFSILLITRHEFWSDEAKAWNIAIGSSSASEFLQNMRDNYGHPFLWNAILYFISHFITQNPESMKVVHLAISTTSAFLFLKYAPFNKITRVLFIFGFFPFYEYSIISRNYALGALSIFLFCVLYNQKYKNMVWLGLVLLLMGQAHVYCFVLSMIFLILLLFEMISDRRSILKLLTKTRLVIFFVIIISSILLIFWELGSQLLQGTVWSPSISNIFNLNSEEFKQLPLEFSKSIINAFFQVPNFVLDYRDTNLVFSFFSRLNHIYLYILATILFIFPILLLKKKICYLYFLGTISLFMVIFFIYGRASRQFGLIFVFTIACIWISNNDAAENNWAIKLKSNFNNRLVKIFLYIILSISIIGSAFAGYLDFKMPFSLGKLASEYIRANYNEDGLLISGYKDVDTQTISAYLNKDFYFPQTNTVGRFCSYSKRLDTVEEEDIFIKTLSLYSQDKKILAIIHRKAIKDAKIPEKYLFKRIDKKFGNSLVGYEDLVLYLFDKSKNKLIADHKSYSYAEFDGISLLGKGQKLLMAERAQELKIASIPIKLESNRDYLVLCEINNLSIDDDYIIFDFFGNNYDNPLQEFKVLLNSAHGVTRQVVWVLNSGDIPEGTDTKFRIYSYAMGSAEISNLEIYEVEYSQ